MNWLDVWIGFTIGSAVTAVVVLLIIKRKENGPNP